MNFLSETAARSSFAYYAGNELLQMTENTWDPLAGDAVNRFYEAMRAHYPYTGRLIDSFIAHTHADQKLGHESVFAEMCDASRRCRGPRRATRSRPRASWPSTWCCSSTGSIAPTGRSRRSRVWPKSSAAVSAQATEGP